MSAGLPPWRLAALPQYTERALRPAQTTRSQARVAWNPPVLPVLCTAALWPSAPVYSFGSNQGASLLCYRAEKSQVQSLHKVPGEPDIACARLGSGRE